MQRAETVFLDAIAWLKASWADLHPVVERDVVWSVQKQLTRQIAERQLDLKVFNDFGMLPGKRRSLSADIVLGDSQGSILVAAEFKFEPCHKRSDIPKGKFPVVFWNMEGVAKDIERIRTFVNAGRASVAHALFIDEGGHFRSREAHPGSAWESWGVREDGGPFVLRSRAVAGSPAQPTSTLPPAAGSP